jgi:hypothetical protein
LQYASQMQQGSVMNSQRDFRRHSAVAAIAALGLTVAAWPAAAQHAQHPQVVYIASADSPPPPAGMQLVCVTASNDGAPTAKTCPVVQYQGVTTCPFRYADNRTSLALVSYDSAGKIIGTVEKPGARYAFDAESSDYTQTVLFVGQALKYVTATWAEIGPR